MEFTIEQKELNVQFIEQLVHSFRKQRHGDFPTLLLLSVKNTRTLCDELRKIACGFEGTPPFKIFGIKIVRCLDIEENKLELH
jgi:hypothetical protein